MRRVRIAGLCIIAVLAVGTAMAASASASLPEWGGCELTPEGKYADAACTEKASKGTGHYEWYTGHRFGWIFHLLQGLEFPAQLSHHKFQVTFGATSFETSTGAKMACTGGSGGFFLENENTKGMHEGVLNFTGCEADGQPCRSPFYTDGEVNNDQKASEEVEDGGAKGTLGYVSGKNTASPVVGLTLSAGAKNGRLLEAVCEAPSVGTVWIGGEHKKEGANAVISLMSPVDEMVGESEELEVHAFTQTFSQSGGSSSPAAFENGKSTVIDAFINSAWVPVGLEGAWEDASEAESAPIEIKAVK